MLPNGTYGLLAVEYRSCKTPCGYSQQHRCVLIAPIGWIWQLMVTELLCIVGCHFHGPSPFALGRCWAAGERESGRAGERETRRAAKYVFDGTGYGRVPCRVAASRKMACKGRTSGIVSLVFFSQGHIEYPSDILGFSCCPSANPKSPAGQADRIPLCASCMR